MLFFRIIQHLLPRAAAWRITIDKPLRRFFLGLAGWLERDDFLLTEDEQTLTTEDGHEFLVEGSGFTNPRRYSDEVFEDIFPATTRELAEWESQFGLVANPSETIRRQNLAAEWAARGGQSPAYIQGVFQTAGFNVFVHEWWSSGPPYVARDPRDFADQPLIGQYQHTASADLAHQPQCTGFTVGGLPVAGQPQCDRFLANDPHYIVNLDLTPRAPPPIPSDPNAWPFFFYLGAETFPDHVSVPASRRGEFERLVQKLKPSQQWVVTLVDYT